MSERAFAPIYEISSENKIAGRRPIKVVLHEIFPDNTRWQENGISWKEEYVQANLHSVVGMSIVAEFLTEDRDVPYNHGMTDVREEDNAAKEAAEASLVEANAKITEMQNAAAVAELNAALAPYTEEQRAVAKEDIDAFNSNPGSVEINSIVGKICTAMVQAARESQIAETNAASQIDVFGMTDDAGKKENTDPADVDVF